MPRRETRKQSFCAGQEAEIACLRGAERHGRLEIFAGQHDVIGDGSGNRGFARPLRSAPSMKPSDVRGSNGIVGRLQILRRQHLQCMLNIFILPAAECLPEEIVSQTCGFGPRGGRCFLLGVSAAVMPFQLAQDRTSDNSDHQGSRSTDYASRIAASWRYENIVDRSGDFRSSPPSPNSIRGRPVEIEGSCRELTIPAARLDGARGQAKPFPANIGDSMVASAQGLKGAQGTDSLRGHSGRAEARSRLLHTALGSCRPSTVTAADEVNTHRTARLFGRLMALRYPCARGHDLGVFPIPTEPRHDLPCLFDRHRAGVPAGQPDFIDRAVRRGGRTAELLFRRAAVYPAG